MPLKNWTVITVTDDVKSRFDEHRLQKAKELNIELSGSKYLQLLMDEVDELRKDLEKPASKKVAHK